MALFCREGSPVVAAIEALYSDLQLEDLRRTRAVQLLRARSCLRSGASWAERAAFSPWAAPCEGHTPGEGGTRRGLHTGRGRHRVRVTRGKGHTGRGRHGARVAPARREEGAQIRWFATQGVRGALERAPSAQHAYSAATATLYTTSKCESGGDRASGRKRALLRP
eukprot:6399674-Prymnesium_polylepis.1